MMGQWTAEQLRNAAGNLLQAYHAVVRTPDGSQARIVAQEKFAALCVAGGQAGLAGSAGELELVVVDVAEQLPPAGVQRPIDGGTDWIWLMQARFLLERRLDRSVPAVAA